MPLIRAGDRLLLASHNPGKVFEFRGLLAPFGVEIVAAADAGLPEPEETGTTYAENAALKARAALAGGLGLPALADDSGLSVAALGGAPGLYSARWAETPEGGRSFAHAIARVEAELADAGEGSGAAAAFFCVLALAMPGGNVHIYEGRVDGTLRFPATGENGFGYDPIFVAAGHTESFGEMDPLEKQRVNHRQAAFAKFTAHALE